MTTAWSYDYSPYTSQQGKEIPAYEVFDEEGRTVLNTNENLPRVQQENAARLAATALELAAAAEKVIQSWENGNLAAAIRELAAILYYAKEPNNSA